MVAAQVMRRRQACGLQSRAVWTVEMHSPTHVIDSSVRKKFDQFDGLQSSLRTRRAVTRESSGLRVHDCHGFTC